MHKCDSGVLFVIVGHSTVDTQVVLVILVEEGFGDLFEGKLFLFGAIVDHVGLFVHENLSPHEFYESWTVDFWVDCRDFTWVPSEQLGFGPVFQIFGNVVDDKEIYDGYVVDEPAALGVVNVSLTSINELLVLLSRKLAIRVFVLFVLTFHLLVLWSPLDGKKDRVVDESPLLEKIIVFLNLYDQFVNIAILSSDVFIFELEKTLDLFLEAVVFRIE